MLCSGRSVAKIPSKIYSPKPHEIPSLWFFFGAVEYPLKNDGIWVSLQRWCLVQSRKEKKRKKRVKKYPREYFVCESFKVGRSLISFGFMFFHRLCCVEVERILSSKDPHDWSKKNCLICGLVRLSLTATSFSLYWQPFTCIFIPFLADVFGWILKNL